MESCDITNQTKGSFIGNIPVTSTQPLDGQHLQYDGVTKQFIYVDGPTDTGQTDSTVQTGSKGASRSIRKLISFFWKRIKTSIVRRVEHYL